MAKLATAELKPAAEPVAELPAEKWSEPAAAVEATLPLAGTASADCARVTPSITSVGIPVLELVLEARHAKSSSSLSPGLFDESSGTSPLYSSCSHRGGFCRTSAHCLGGQAPHYSAGRELQPLVGPVPLGVNISSTTWFKAFHHVIGFSLNSGAW